MDDDKQQLEHAPGQTPVPASGPAQYPPEAAEQQQSGKVSDGSADTPPSLPQASVTSLVQPQSVAAPVDQAGVSSQQPAVVAPVVSGGAQTGSAAASMPQREADLEWHTAGDTHDTKNGLWFGSMIMGSVGIALIIALLTRDKAVSVVVLFALIGVIIYSSRQPKAGHYAFYDDALYIDSKLYSLKTFKSFSKTAEKSGVVFRLEPLKRFMPYIILSSPENISDEIVSYLTAYLPQQEHKADMTEEIFRRLKM